MSNNISPMEDAIKLIKDYMQGHRSFRSSETAGEDSVCRCEQCVRGKEIVERGEEKERGIEE